jgi:hypothetical protein
LTWGWLSPGGIPVDDLQRRDVTVIDLVQGGVLGLLLSLNLDGEGFQITAGFLDDVTVARIAGSWELEGTTGNYWYFEKKAPSASSVRLSGQSPLQRHHCRISKSRRWRPPSRRENGVVSIRDACCASFSMTMMASLGLATIRM